MSKAPELLLAAGITALMSAMAATMLAIINKADVMAFSNMNLRVKCYAGPRTAATLLLAS
jgi:hypothetical protein